MIGYAAVMHKQIIQKLDADGMFRFDGLWSPDEVAEAAFLVRAALADGLDGSGVRVFRPAELAPRLRHLLTGGALARALERSIGPCDLLSVKPVVKDGGHGFATPWHQDRPYWGGCVKWSVWIALDRVDPGNGCLRVLRGSHTRDCGHHAGGDNHGFAHRAEVDERRAEDAVLAAGDALLFHDLLLHASHPCQAGRSRIALIPTYRVRGIVDDSHLAKPDGLWAEPVAVEAA